MLLLKAPIFDIDIELKHGADSTILLTVVDDDKKPIVNTIGYTARAQIRASESGPILFEWNNSPSSSQGSTSIVYDPDTNKSVLTLKLTAAQSALFTFTTANWDCFVTSPIGEVDCIAEGIVTITPRYTY